MLFHARLLAIRLHIMSFFSSQVADSLAGFLCPKQLYAAHYITNCIASQHGSAYVPAIGGKCC